MATDISKFISQKSDKSSQKGLARQIIDFIASAGASSVAEFARGTTNIIGTAADAVNPVSWLSKAMGVQTPTFGQGIKAIGEQAAKGAEGAYQYTGESGEGAGKLLGGVAAQVPFLVGGGGALSKGKSLLSSKGLQLRKPVQFGLMSAGTTATATAETEGRLPTAKEVVGYGALDAVLLGAGSAIYKSAFRGSGKAPANYLRQFGETIGATAEKLGFAGTAKSISGQAAKSADSVWAKLVKTAESGDMVKPSAFDDIAKNLAKDYDKLPNSEFKQKAIQEINKVVGQFKPKKAITGAEVVNTIKQINKGLFQDGGRTVLSMKQWSSLEKGLASELKDALPEGVKGLYKDYAINSLVRNVMKDAEVQKQLGRTLLGGSIGGGGALSGSIAAGNDPATIAKNTIIGAVVGSLVPRVAGSTFVQTTTGTSLKKGSPAYKIILQKVIDAFGTTSQEGQSAPAQPLTPPAQSIADFIKPIPKP